MELKVTFEPCECIRKFDSDNVVCRFSFSVVDSSLFGTAGERHTNHSLRVSLSPELCEKWGIDNPDTSSVSQDVQKVAFEIALAELTNLFRVGDWPAEEPLITRTTANSDWHLPYEIADIAYPEMKIFTIDVGQRLDHS